MSVFLGESHLPGDIPAMPFSVRHRVAKELNAAWREFITDMHDGPVGGNETAEKFVRYLRCALDQADTSGTP
jgi:ABC-type phosphate/phosphonate transport system substrate-binding protein